MGEITIFTRDGCPNCEAVRVQLKLSHLPFHDMVLDATELQVAPLIFFNNIAIVGGVNELLDVLHDWEVVEGPDGIPTLEPMQPAPTEDQYEHHHDASYYPSHPEVNGHVVEGSMQGEPAHYQDSCFMDYSKSRNYRDHSSQPNYGKDNYLNEKYRHDSYDRDLYNQGQYTDHIDDGAPYSYSQRGGDPQSGFNVHRDYDFSYKDNGGDVNSRGSTNPYTVPYTGHYRDSRQDLSPYREPGRDTQGDLIPHGDPQPHLEAHGRYIGSHPNPYAYRDSHSHVEDRLHVDTHAELHSYRDQHINDDRYGDDHRNPYAHGGSIFYGDSHQDNDPDRGGSCSDPSYRYGSYHEESYGDKRFIDSDPRSNDAAYMQVVVSSRDVRGIEAIQSRFHFARSKGEDPDEKSASANEPHRANNANVEKKALTNQSRSDKLTGTESYERLSCKSLDRQLLRKQKYQDDDDPFRRKAAAGATNTAPETATSQAKSSSKTFCYYRHSFNGKTLLQRHESEQAEQDFQNTPRTETKTNPRPTTTAADTMVSRREMLATKPVYDRHSFHRKTLRQQDENEEVDSCQMKSGQIESRQYDYTQASVRGNKSFRGYGSGHGGKSLYGSGSGPGSSHGGGSVHGGSHAGSIHSRRSIHVDLDRDSLGDTGSDATFSDAEDDDDDANTEADRKICHDGDDRDGTKNYTSGSADELVDGSSRNGDSQKSRTDAKASSATENVILGEEESVLIACSNQGAPSLEDDSNRLKQFSISLRQNSTKDIDTKTMAGKAASMRHLISQDTSSATSTSLESRSRPSDNLLRARSTSPNPSAALRVSTSAMNAGLKVARSAMRMPLDSSMRGIPSTRSLWSNAPGTSTKEDQRTVELPAGNRISVLQAMLELKGMIRIEDLKHNLTTYRNSFTGSTLADTFQERFRLSRRDAEDLGRSLGQAQLIHHVCGEHEYADKDKLYFRLQCHQNPEILNSFCVWRDDGTLTKHASEVMDGVMRRLRVVMNAITDSVKGRVHYSRATKHHEDLVTELDFAICELQMVKLARLDKNSLMAFGLNVYQLFLHYAFIKMGIPSSASSSHSFWTNLKFNIGGDLYSFSDWWNGICRGNRKGPHGPKPFQRTDSRCFLNLPDPLDARVHFAAGMTLLLRPMPVYTAKNINRELEHVARIYCKDVEFVWMETSTCTLTLAPQFKAYQSDFASSTKALPKAILEWLPAEEKAFLDKMLTIQKKIKIEFHDNIKKNDGWDDYAGEHFVYETAPKANFKNIVTSKKKAAPERREVKRQGSLTSMFHLEGSQQFREKS